MSDSVWPHRRQPIRLPRPWDSPGKNTGVGCHFLLQCIKVKSESEVTQSCPTLSDPMDCGQPGSSIHGIFQASICQIWGPNHMVCYKTPSGSSYFFSSAYNKWYRLSSQIFLQTDKETEGITFLNCIRFLANWVAQDCLTALSYILTF